MMRRSRPFRPSSMPELEGRVVPSQVVPGGAAHAAEVRPVTRSLRTVDGRSNGTSRVFSGWIVKPYFSNRLGSTSSTAGRPLHRRTP